jgi:transposase
MRCISGGINVKSEIDLRGFYPEYMEIVEVEQTNGELYVDMESVTTMARCPVCGMESSKRHSGYTRKSIRDLPILGNGVKLLVNAQMYFCINPKCYVVTFTEDLPGITGNRGQWTERCETLIIAIAANTNCESAARICREMKINISGDTVIRMMLRKVREKKYFGEAIGVDDFAIKKGQNYGTMICDMETHQPIALLPGRDGNELKQWLKKNKQVKIVSRDRAGSYAAAISEILPDAIQVADRFHIYHNLLIAVKEAINGILPDKVLITDEPTNIETEKKTKFESN